MLCGGYKAAFQAVHLLHPNLTGSTNPCNLDAITARKTQEE